MQMCLLQCMSPLWHKADLTRCLPTCPLLARSGYRAKRLPMRRRDLIILLGGAAAAGPLAARAQQPMPVIGYFSARSPVTDGPMLSAFRHGLNDTGFVEGRNVAMEFRWAEGRSDRLLELAHDLVRHKVAVIVTTGASLRHERRSRRPRLFRSSLKRAMTRCGSVSSPTLAGRAATSRV